MTAPLSLRQTTDDLSTAASRLVDASRAMRQVRVLAARAAAGDAKVFITGESGVGKDVVAQYIHAHSSRASRPFIAVNCAAIADTLLETEYRVAVKTRHPIGYEMHSVLALSDRTGARWPRPIRGCAAAGSLEHASGAALARATASELITPAQAPPERQKLGRPLVHRLTPKRIGRRPATMACQKRTVSHAGRRNPLGQWQGQEVR